MDAGYTHVEQIVSILRHHTHINSLYLEIARYEGAIIEQKPHAQLSCISTTMYKLEPWDLQLTVDRNYQVFTRNYYKLIYTILFLIWGKYCYLPLYIVMGLRVGKSIKTAFRTPLNSTSLLLLDSFPTHNFQGFSTHPP
jgi:hypothetical protein